MIFFLLIWSISILGFFALASTMSKHQKQIFGHELNASKTKLTTIIGWCLLIISLIISLIPNTLSNGISYWVGVLTFAALFVGLCLSYFAHQIKSVSWIMLILAIASALIYLI